MLDKKDFLVEALLELVPQAQFHSFNGNIELLKWLDEREKPTNETILNKVQELEAAEPLRLLRIERDRLLQQTDWEIQRNTERNIDSTELITYRNALRDLPQEIESGNISAPTIDDQGNLIFDNWPVRGE